MTEVAIISDTHFGARGDKAALLEHMESFYEQVFFPTLKNRDIKQIWHLGDIVDRRKFINYETLYRMRKTFLEPLSEEFTTNIILGNHDQYFKNRAEPNALNELIPDKIKIYTRPEIYENITIIPWICEETEFEARRLISEARTRFCFGHLELKNWEMDRGRFSHDGDDKEDYRGFDAVLSGHYHHKSSYNNIHYVGAPYQMSWTDYNDTKGFHIFNMESGDLEFIENPNSLFYKFVYNDKDKPFNLLLEEIKQKPSLKGSFVKVIITNKSNDYLFDSFIDRLNSAGVGDVQIVDDHRNMDLESDEIIIEQAEDTLTILNKYIENMHADVDTQELESLLKELYDEAEILRV